YAERVAETVAWLAREMRQSDGGFASSLDADSEHEEGKFYVWSEAEIDALLGARAARFKEIYDVTPAGNWEGHTILNRLDHLEREADPIEAELAAERAVLLQARAPRVRPGLDDKVLADWNGLMIAALANASQILGEPSWFTMAERTFAFIARAMTRGDRLGHSWRQGQLKFP